MKRVLPLVALLPLAACQAYQERPYAPVETVEYSALGHDPFWLATIGDDRIVLTLGDPGGRADGGLESYSWPRVLPREADGVKRWESGGPGGSIAIEARPGPCTGGDGARFADRVTVTYSGGTLTGCGGRMLTGRRS